jgi:peptide/nickel transport system substrate-binding protein
VKWNVERLYRFADIMPWADKKFWSYMYFLQDGSGKPIVNETIIIDEYTVRFVLNSPYAPFIALLATTFILSPFSTPENDYVDKFNGTLVGTGPFKIDSYDMNPIDEICRDIVVTAYKDYWGGQPKIDTVHFQTVSGSERTDKILSGDIHYTPAGLWSPDPELIEACKNSTSVNVVAPGGLGVYYICMNNDLFPLEMRKAMSYAFNYSEYITTFYGDLAFRAKSPLPKGTLYSNCDLNAATTNLSVARQTLIDAAWPGTSNLTANNNISIGNEWEKLVEDGTPLATYNFSIIGTSSTHVAQSILLTKYFKQIGIKLNQNNLTPSEHEDKLYSGGMEFYADGWGMAFNDPIEMLNPLFSETSWFNNYNFSDTQVENWLNQGIIEFNETSREQIYYNIQKRLVEELYPVIWTHTIPFWEIWASSVKGLHVDGAFFKLILKYTYFEDS